VPEWAPSIVRALLVISLAGGSAAGADDTTHRQLTESGLREGQEILASELFGHYDVTRLVVVGIEPLPSRAHLKHDYGLATVTLTFSTKRNATRHPALNPVMFESGSPMCKDWLYLHCGVPVGHVFEGHLLLLLAADRQGSWRAVSPHWRSRREYPLHGYLLLEGRAREGYVLFPTPRER
jgi:hypothetical protein